MRLREVWIPIVLAAVLAFSVGWGFGLSQQETPECVCEVSDGG